MRNVSTVLALGCLTVCGCNVFAPPQNPAEVLEGTWSVTPGGLGALDVWEYEARFNSNGRLVELSGTNELDGSTVSLTIDDATTQVNGSDVTITIPDLAGARVFEGTLSDDQNRITGSTTDEIDLGSLEATIPSGDLTLERL
jgi:hypothetical protein